MSDRRPEKSKLWVKHDEQNRCWISEASPADLVAAIREGVESGTIKGRVMRECEHGLLHEVDPDTEGWDLRCPFNDSDVPCQMSITLVVPVSDGGSET